MPILGQGRYKVTVKSASVDKLGNSNLAAIKLGLEAYEMKNQHGEYEPIDSDGYYILSDQYLEQKDGSVNDQKIRTLGKVFDWNGDVMMVEGWVGKRCKITVVEKEFKGKIRPEVSWLNHIDDTDGGGSDFDATKAKAVQQAIGSKLRAILGSSAPRTAPVSTPVAPATPPARPVPTSTPTHTIESVWAIVEAQLVSQNVPKDMHGSAWDSFLKEQGVADADKVADWAPLAVAGETFEYLPFN
jgi:hypothetical protein